MKTKRKPRETTLPELEHRLDFVDASNTAGLEYHYRRIRELEQVVWDMQVDFGERLEKLEQKRRPKKKGVKR